MIHAGEIDDLRLPGAEPVLAPHEHVVGTHAERAVSRVAGRFTKMTP